MIVKLSFSSLKDSRWYEYAVRFGLGGAESYPGVFGPFGGFSDGVEVENGFITLSNRPGIGFEGKSDLIKIMRALAE